ncbi:MAG: AAA family ATPase [Actinomycetia bacterium]|nr:AAA family ATPase [Actinomycetes bacterium]
MASERRLCLLGPPAWVGSEGFVAFKPSKPHALACVLAAHAGQMIPRTQLLLMLWEDLDEADGRRILSTSLTRLRQAWPEIPIRAVGDFLTWAIPGSATVDTWLFQQAVEHGHWDDAVALWRGPFLEGFHIRAGAAYEEWLEQQRHRWTRQVVEALDRLTAADEAARQWDRVIRHAERALALEPLEERFHRRLIRAHYFAGNRTAALAQFHVCQEMLRRELGVEPEPETVTLARAVASARLVLPDAPTPRGRGADSHPVPTDTGTERLPLFGREAELTQLEGYLGDILEGQGRMVVMCGAMGIGKTRLVHALLAGPEGSLRHRMATVLVGHCYETAVELPYGPLVEALARLDPAGDWSRYRLPPDWAREVARLWPGRSDPQVTAQTPASLSSDGKRRLFEGVVQLILALPQPVLLVLEDLHWADEATLQFLSYLARHPQAGSLALLVTVRLGELPEAVERLLRQLEYEHRARWMDIGPLSCEATAALVSATTGHADPVLAEHLFAETHGNPLFTIVWARSLADSGNTEDPHPRSLRRVPVPATLQTLILGRMQRLSPAAQEVLRAASIFPRPVPFECLCAVIDAPEAAILSALDMLTRARLLEETDQVPLSSFPCAGRHAAATVVGFSHDLVRQAVLGGSSPSRLARLHGRAFRHFLEATAKTPTDARTLGVLESLAYHATAAGLSAEGLTWSLKAADAAEAVFAYGDAARFLEQALANLARLPQTPEYFGLGVDIRLRLTDIGLPMLPAQTDEWLAEAADSAAAIADAHRVSQVETVRALALGTQGRLGHAITVLDKGLPLARKLRSPSVLALCLLYLGQLRAVRGEFDRSVSALGEAIPLLEDLGRIRHAAYGRCTWASVKATQGHFEETAHMPRALADEWLGRGNEAVAAHALCHAAVIAHLQGRWADAEAAGEEAVRIAARSRQRLSEYVARVFLGLPVARLGKLADGIRIQEGAIALATAIRLRILLDRAYAFLALLRLDEGELDEAERAARTGLDIAKADGYLAGIALNTKVLGDVLAARGEQLEARHILLQARTQLAALGFRPELARCHAALAIIATSPAERRYHRDVACALFDQMGMVEDKVRLVSGIGG